eukprot:TRINITY_DN24721_c0_g1_i1.p1 TRINITY_DN24721_c0_g1~~TRINITY_DN24721_c0_g1_i1.p1  ORF type:complete len:276 (+),score=37.09 TRINITY_DN24721_c0_g1_i1:68-829(+)
MLPRQLFRRTAGLRYCSKRSGQQQRRWATTVLKGGQSDNPWKTLGVNRGIDDAGLKKAYIKLAKQHHPDRTGGDDKMFKKVKEAYDLIKKGDANRMYPEHATPGAANQGANWAGGFQGFQANQQKQGFENMQYSSSHTTHDRFGGEETVYTYRDSNGQTFTYHEKKHSGDENFWNTFRSAQQEALNQEANRMKERAAHNEQFRKVFDNWAAHKMNESVDYQEYVRQRDRAFYRFIILWFWLFIMFRILINIFV